ncbi:protein [Escherichia coli]|nr:protein [Escherichia coli]
MKQPDFAKWYFYQLLKDYGKRLARTVLIFTERSDQLSRATDRVPGLPASPGYVQ